MINFKKGPALSLHQVNYVAAPAPASRIEAGHVVRIGTDGLVYKGSSDSTPDPNALYGFAINSYDAGDVIESGKIGVYALDGASVIETDKTYPATINASNFPIGSLLTTNTSGEVVKLGTQDGSVTNSKVIGQVEGIRTIPGKVREDLTDNNGNVFKVQANNTTVLGVKLAS